MYFKLLIEYTYNVHTKLNAEKKHDVELTIDVTIIKWIHPLMCKTGYYDVKKDCNMYAIHTIKKW